MLKVKLRELKKENKIAEFGRVTWLYTKYQIITKGILLAVVFNLSSRILNYLIKNQIANLEDIKKIKLDGYSLNKDLSDEKNLIFTRKNS